MKTDPFDFIETDRVEHCFIPYITYKNDYHQVTIYYDDPITDSKTVEIKTYGKALTMSVFTNKVYVTDNLLTHVPADKISEMAARLKITEKSAIKLQELLNNGLPHLEFED